MEVRVTPSRRELINGLNSWAELKPYLQVHTLVAAPDNWKRSKNPTGPWLITSQHEIKRLLTQLKHAAARPSPYQIRRGVCTDLNAVFWMQIMGGHRSGRVAQVIQFQEGAKHQLTPYNNSNHFLLETMWLYPLLRGREVHPFAIESPTLAVLIPQTQDTGIPLGELEQYHYLARYLRTYERQLRLRASFRRYHKPRDAPYWSLWDCGPYTFSAYKVVVREIAQRTIAAVINTLADGNSPLQQVLAGKQIVPDHKLFFLSTESEDEAHYLCALLNSPSAVCLLKAWGAQRHIGVKAFLERLRPPQYRLNNHNHRCLVNLSQLAHRHQGCLSASRLQQLDEFASKAFQDHPISEDNFRKSKRPLTI